MSRPQRKKATEVIEFFQTLDSDVEETDSDREFFDSGPDEDSDDADPGPSTSAKLPPKRMRPSGDVAPAPTGDWTEDLTGFPPGVPFTGQPGMHVPDNVETPLDFFRLFFTADILRVIKTETNRYAASELGRRQLPPESLYKNWSTVTLKELWGFFTIWVHMSLVKKPCLKDYWSTAEIIRTSFAPKIMSRNRFMQILGFLHLNVNTTYVILRETGHDPLHKLRPIIDPLSATFRDLVTHQQKLVIDEAICPWRGNLWFRVYMKDKPNKWGIKLYMLCAGASAYVCAFEINAADPTISNKPVDVCRRMMLPLMNKGYILYTDNYYTCPALYHEMIAGDTMIVGTVRANCVDMPKDLAALNLRTGKCAYRWQDELVALHRQDKKSVNLLTTVHDPRRRVTVRSRAQTNEKPQVVQDYTLNMRGKDCSDQLMAYMPFHRRTMKWWKKLFGHLFTLMMVQASILYNRKQTSTGGKPLPISKFTQKLGQGMAEEFLGWKEGDSEDPAPTQLDRLHSCCFPNYIPSTEKKKRPTRSCKVCYEKAKQPGSTMKRKETSFWCPYHKVPLCVVPCFQDFHTKKEYCN